MWDSSHTHTHYTINQIGTSQSPPLKFLTSSLGPTLQGSISEPTRDYRVGFDTICNDPRKSASHICAIPQKDQSQLSLLIVVNKIQIYLVNTRCGTHHTPTHITQSIKLRHHTLTRQNLRKRNEIQTRPSLKLSQFLYKNIYLLLLLSSLSLFFDYFIQFIILCEGKSFSSFML